MKTARTRAVADDGGRAGAALSLALPVLFFSLFAVFGLGFIARATRMFAGSTGIVFGMTPGMEGLLWIPWALGVLAAAMGGACVLAWRRRYWGGMRRGLYSLLTFGALLAVQFLVQWNYLPPRW